MINDITTIKQNLNINFYGNTINELASQIENDLETRVTINQSQLIFRISKKVAKSNKIDLNDSVSGYSYIESLLRNLYLVHSSEIRGMGINMDTLLHNISYMYRFNIISGNNIIIEL